MSGGYVHCKCRDCFEIAIEDEEGDGAFCHACESAGCSEDSECDAPHTYCGDAEEVEVDGKPYCEACGQPF